MPMQNTASFIGYENDNFQMKNNAIFSKVNLVCFSFFVFRYSIKGEVSLFFAFRFSFFDIRIRAEYRILTFEILF